MARTLLFSAGLGALLAWNWARLEHPRPHLGSLVLMVSIGIAPVLLPRRVRTPGAVVAVVGAAGLALHIWPYDFGRLAGNAGSGFVSFYDVAVPFDGGVHPLMHDVLLLAACAFTLLCALAVASRRPLAASLALVAGAGWPATIYPGGDDLQRGALLLVGALALVAWLRQEGRRAAPQAIAGTAFVLLALIVSSSGAVAKSQFLDWQHWDFYNRPAKDVSVEFVWHSSYSGIHFPAKRTQVLTVSAPERSTYWRATTLDAVSNGIWQEDFRPASSIVIENGRYDLSGDPLLPDRARNPKTPWTGVTVRIDALHDPRLAGPTQPVAYEPKSIEGVQYLAGGIALATLAPDRGSVYKVWAYQPEPTPAALARSRPKYPAVMSRDGLDLTVDQRPLPPFGAPGREAWIADYFAHDDRARVYEPLYRTAKRIVGNARNPYAATVALEAWFRSSGGFIYDESPPRALGDPLVYFVTRTRRGYCQHFAGAMALMLRYLGIPARVAAGFTSGTWDSKSKTWRVYDRNAHTWVEVWFRGYGWLSFDPTPARGNLGGPYTAASLAFDAPGAVKVLAASAIAGRRLLRFQLVRGGRPGKGDPGGPQFTDRPKSAASPGQGRGIGVTGILLLVAFGLALLLAGVKFGRRWRRLLTRDPRVVATACRRDLVEYLRDQRVDVPPSAALEELRQLTKEETGVDPRGLVEAVGLARFGPLSAASTAARRARGELRVVRRRLRRAYSAGARLRGLFSLRSLLPS